MTPTHLTRLAHRFFRAYCHPDFLEDLDGDLQELYEERLLSMRSSKAQWYYVRDVLWLFRPAIIRPLKFNRLSSNQSPAMYRNYFKTGFRNLLKYRSYALLNIFGLAIGIAAALVLFLIVGYERSFDAFHPDHQQVYRVGEQRTGEGGVTYYLTKTPVLPTLMETFPEVVDGTRFFSPDYLRFRYQENINKSLVHYVDSGFVDLFSFEVVAGDLKSTLTHANRVALTASVARKLFGSESGVGKVLEVVNSEDQFTVGAILADPPANSSLQFEVLIPWLSAPDWLATDRDGNWYNTFMTTYVKLAPQTDLAAFKDKLIPFKNRYFTSDDLSNLQMVLLPLADLRAEETDNASIITLLSVIAIITLIIVCVNFMNLATAQSLLRIREIGVRKAVGSRRSQLVGQFLTESLLTCLLALLIGVLLIQLTLPSFNRYFDLPLEFYYWQNMPLLAALLTLGLGTGLLSGLYPALFASGMRPVDALKGSGARRRSGRVLQKGLIVLQYAASILLIAGTLIIWRQIQFMQHQDVNFQKDHVVAVPLYYNNFAFESEAQAQSALQRVRAELANEAAIQSVAFAENVPGRYNHNYNHFARGEAPQQEPVSLRQVTVGTNYFSTLGMQFEQGRDFSEKFASDSSAVIINQTAMKALGWSDLQDKFLVAGGDGEHHPVVGVVEDFHYESLQHKIGPLIFRYGGPDYVSSLAVRLQPNAVPQGLRALESAYQTLNPYEPFDYFFLDQEFDKMYRAQERLGLTATLFAAVAVVLASLGLLALAAFATRQRQKEVGVRKVLGASVGQIVVLLSRNFAGLVALAFVMACPLIYYGAERFLQDFAYRIALGPDVFLIAGAIALLVAGLSVSAQALRAASENPVEALRDE